MIQDLIRQKQETISTLPPELQRIISRGRDDIALFANELLGMKLHRGQERFYKHGKAKINVLVPCNRYGKSVIIAIKQIHKNFYKIGVGQGNMKAWFGQEYRTANIAPQSAMTEPVFVIMKQILTGNFTWEEDGRVVSNDCKITWFYDEKRTLNTPPYKICFTNNSYCEHRSLGADKGDSLQGKPYGYISYDEAGRSDHLEREIDDNILPRLFDWNGQLDLVSTPDMNSPSILHHYDLYMKGKNNEEGYYTQEGSLRENTFFPEEVVDKQYRLYENNPIGPQVLEGKFVFAGTNLYPAEDVLAAQDSSLDDGERYREGHKYIIGIDTAIGDDEMVYSVLKEPLKGCDCCQEYKLVRQIACKGASKSPQVHLMDFLDLVDSYLRENNVIIILETWNGESARFYEDLPSYIRIRTKCYGSWQPSKKRSSNTKMRSAKKADMLIALRKLLAERKLKIPKSNQKLTRQLSIYREDDKKLQTDRLISLALACWMATDGQPNKEAKMEMVEW